MCNAQNFEGYMKPEMAPAMAWWGWGGGRRRGKKAVTCCRAGSGTPEPNMGTNTGEKGVVGGEKGTLLLGGWVERHAAWQASRL